MFDRNFYIPKGSRKVADKKSSAVVYLYERPGKFIVMAFHGKARKPDFHYSYGTEAQRTKRVAEFFAAWQGIEGRKVETRAAQKAWVNPYKVGDLFRRSWGYDQTNVDWYEVVSVKGKRLAVREIAQERTHSTDMSGKTVPLPGQFTSAERVCLAQDGRIKINHYAHAYYVKPEIVAGVPVYGSDYWSSYA
jgi:hypothetical protein